MFEELLGRIGRELDSRGMPYMIIGGQAVLLYGEPRLTRDIDVALGIGAEQCDAVIEAASCLDLEPLPADAVEFIRQTRVLPAGPSPRDRAISPASSGKGT